MIFKRRWKMFFHSWSDGKNLIISQQLCGNEKMDRGCALKHILLVINRLSFSLLFSECLPNIFTLIAMPFLTWYAIKTFQLNCVCLGNVNQTWMGSEFILLNRKIFMVKSQIHFRLFYSSFLFILTFFFFHFLSRSNFFPKKMLYQRMGVNCGEFFNICS